MKISINGDVSHVVTANHEPVFFIFSAQSDSTSAYNPYTIIQNLTFISVSSPNDFSLIKLVSKSGHREAKIGNSNITGSQTGVMDKDRVRFEYSQVRDGVYKVLMQSPLDPGEYAFVEGMTMGSSVFDFSVR